ncbi:hypothetical protein chiPu_0005181 [Chiloscyllium punctatum]|uniref:PDZ domain-containing protein n=1 Tax=Chiloscyllium punctatum TaxID=137246 RepID=A0A401S8P3_CHIPU|nr:hypothetical protein [Chiloscyllium punctatum]
MGGVTEEPLWGHWGENGETKSLTIVLHRENDTLGFNIIGGRPNPESEEDSPSEGIYVSKVMEKGPADRADGLEVHDRIIEEAGAQLYSQKEFPLGDGEGSILLCFVSGIFSLAAAGQL